MYKTQYSGGIKVDQFINDEILTNNFFQIFIGVKNVSYVENQTSRIPKRFLLMPKFSDDTDLVVFRVF